MSEKSENKTENSELETTQNDIDRLIDKTELEHMLEFETQIFLDIIQKDGLVVAAKGLSLDLVVLNVLKVYCDPGNLVLVLNSDENEEKYFRNKLNNLYVYSTTCNINVNEREESYLSGGIHFVTTRILVVDLLKKRIPIEKITGFIVLRAHRIFESCQEAFVLRLFRQANKTGFIKAFSNSSQSFTMGFGQVERCMRALFVKELYIWPRFHSMVIQTLKKHQPQVIELHIPISAKMQKTQTYILELMNLTVKEIKRLNKTIELQEITVENCLTKKFHKILQAQLDLIWNQLSSKSKQLVADLKTLRHLIISMLYTDSVSFYSILSGYRSVEYAQSSTWVWLEPAEQLFNTVNSSVFNSNKEFNPELSPKWESLLEILKIEIPNAIKKSGKKDNKILILCSDRRTCYQINQLLTVGPYHYLFMKALRRNIQVKNINSTFKRCGNLPDKIPENKLPDKSKKENQQSTSKKFKTENPKNELKAQQSDNVEEELEEFQSSYILTMSQTLCGNDSSINDSMKTSSDEGNDTVFEPFSQMENMNLTQICEALDKNQPTILIQTFKGFDNYISLQQTLHELKPNYVIMYHSNMTAIRELEMYEAHRQRSESLLVYFMLHNETVEEQSYLTTLRREKEAFEFLIETKSSMVVPEDQDGKSDVCLALQRELLNSPTKNTRKGGKEVEPIKQTVIVDMREFRSELPALIHKRGIEIEPVTITVGDYIITNEICIERKSLSDLIGSLNSGRLYQQCVQMSRYYTKPMLLIEFDHNRPFSWLNHYTLSTDSCSNFDIQQKLLLLTLHFPKLRIIWSPSPYASAQLFEELKQGKEQPNIEYANAIGGEEDLDVIETKYNSSIYDFMIKLPGITSKNIDGFLRKTGNMGQVVKKTEDELKELLGNGVDAKALYSIIHEEHVPKEDQDSKQKGKKFIKYGKNKK